MALKQILLVAGCYLLLSSYAYAQKAETFDVITYTTPKGWQKKVNTSAIQLGVDGAKGACLVTIFKAVPGTENARENFNVAWDAIVKETVKVATAPEMQPSTREKGWTVESGLAPYESDGKKGIALLMTMTGDKKMVNILVLSNTDAYKSELNTFLTSVSLAKVVTPEARPEPAKTVPVDTPRKGNFKFNTTNFDDGWTAVEQDLWVKATKGNLTVLIHYPNKKADAYNSVLKVELQTAWDTLVAPRYTNIQNFELKPIQSFESIAFAEADAEDKATGKNVHIVLFKKHFSRGNGKYLEFITSNKKEFEQEFGPYHNTEFAWDKLVNLQTKNRFAVSASDLAGKWTSSGFASLSYYYVNGGGYAGTTATTNAYEFTFSNSGTYQSEYSGASGVVGNQKFSQQIYKGNFTTDRWTMTLTNRFQGKPETYSCYFEAVQGGRVLVMTDKQNTVTALVRQTK